MIKRTVIRKIIKRAFEVAKFSQPDVAKIDDDDSWLRRNDNFIPMFGVTQPKNSHVYNPAISPREIPNVRKDFMAPRKRIRVAKANNVVKLS
jgi:hypothetical protein